jgi:hypothetical protein
MHFQLHFFRLLKDMYALTPWVSPAAEIMDQGLFFRSIGKVNQPCFTIAYADTEGAVPVAGWHGPIGLGELETRRL